MNISEILKWIVDNMEWIFSGIGISILGLLINKNIQNKRSQVIKGKSSGMQAGRDINIKR